MLVQNQLGIFLHHRWSFFPTFFITGGHFSPHLSHSDRCNRLLWHWVCKRWVSVVQTPQIILVLFTYGHSCIHLLQQIDANVAKHLSQPWKATLPVNGLLCSRQYSAPPLGDDFIPLDLFHYTDPTWKGYHVRFDTHEFPVVPGGLTSNKEGRKKLVKHLSTISHLRGSCQLISNGGGKSRYHYMSILGRLQPHKNFLPLLRHGFTA